MTKAKKSKQNPMRVPNMVAIDSLDNESLDELFEMVRIVHNARFK